MQALRIKAWRPAARWVAAVALAACLLPGGVRAGDRQPVVVELFTSQGCSSCPPADAVLDELADDPNVIALSMHVDYWDYIGWKDPFASPVISERQRDYAHEMQTRYVYTPQMVIDGRIELVGSHRSDVHRLVAEAAERSKPLTLRFEEEGGGRVVIPAGEAPDGGAQVWLVNYDAAHETEVLRGENRGKTLRYRNVVRELEQVGAWDGGETAIPLDLAAAAARGRDGCAVIVQAGEGGPVLGAISMDIAATD